MTAELKGVIHLDVRDSQPDWDPFLPTRAPEGAPNVGRDFAALLARD